MRKFCKKTALLLSVAIYAVLISGCSRTYESLGSYFDTWTFLSLDKTYQLEVEYSWEKEDEEIDMFSKPLYTFYWREEDGQTDPLASVWAGATSAESSAFIGFGKWLENTDGDAVYSNEESYWITWQDDSVLVEFGTWLKKQKIELEYPDRTVRTQSFTQDIDNAERPEVISVEMTADCYGQISQKVSVADVYATNFAVNRTVGLVGAPLDIFYLDSLSDVQLTFFYDEAQLGSTAEENLIVQYYDDETHLFTELTEAEIDTRANTVTVPISKKGVYLLVDLYQRYFARGVDIHEWPLDKNDIVYDDKHKVSFETKWDLKYDTSDIRELASLEWAVENAPEFHVTTAEQLASVVYYVNTFAEEEIRLYLESDIDLSGYAWAPMGWRQSKCAGISIYGMGHTISNMTIDFPEKTDIGFIGYGCLQEVSNLHFENASVSGDNFVGILCGVDYQCPLVQSVTVEGSVNADGKHCGAIFGYELGVDYQDCAASVIVNGTKSPYFSYYQKEQSENS